jgi:hypothetical protein
MEHSHIQPADLVIEPVRLTAEFLNRLLTRVDFSTEVVTAGPAGLDRIAGLGYSSQIGGVDYGIPCVPRRCWSQLSRQSQLEMRVLL